jgi:TRAP-type C4-dicarboxylate transport system permease small subunit
MGNGRRCRSRWYEIPVRAVLWTFIGTLICFAISLFLGIVGVALVSAVRHVHPDMTLAYRDVAFPAALVAGAVILLFVLRMEIRHYRQTKTLEAIERAS